jgi:hypothetical protein
MFYTKTMFLLGLRKCCLQPIQDSSFHGGRQNTPKAVKKNTVEQKKEDSNPKHQI